MHPYRHNPPRSDARSQRSYPDLFTPVASSPDLWIFPSTPDAPPRDARPLYQHPPPQDPIPRTTAYGSHDLPQILVFYRGEPSIYLFGYGRDAAELDDHVWRRVGMSVTAHLRRAATHAAQNPGAPPPMLGIGVPIDLRYIDFPLDINLDTTRTAFGIILQELAPPGPLGVSGGRGRRLYTVSEWDILCRRCGMAIRHFCTDEFWNGRYILHLREEVCRNATQSVGTRLNG